MARAGPLQPAASRTFAVALVSMGLASCGEVLDVPSDIALDPHLVCDEDGCRCEDGFARCGAESAGCATDVRSSAEHCGACGNGCGDGSCVSGLCTPTELAGIENAGIAWFGGGARIAAASVDPLSLSGPVALVSLEGGISSYLNAPNTFWESAYSIFDGEGDTYVLSSLAGQTLSGVYAFEGGDTMATSLCLQTGALVLVGVTAKFVYFSRGGSTVRCRAPRGESSVEDQCTGGLSSVVPLVATAAGSRSYWASAGGGISVWTDDNVKASLLAGEPGATILALGVSGEELYLVESFAACPGEAQTACDRVSAIPVLGGARRVLSVIPVDGPPAFPPSMVIDGTYVYLFDGRAEGALLRVPVEGGEPRRIGARMFAAGRALSDERALYFTDHSAVYRFEKPTKGALP